MHYIIRDINPGGRWESGVINEVERFLYIHMHYSRVRVRVRVRVRAAMLNPDVV